ncbi:MAG: FkbM family methyltransferase [Candidatus Pelagisphaera sp.]|jgi:FkbM family methyltransferase
MLQLPTNQLSKNTNFKESDLFRSFQQSPLGFIDVGARGGIHDLVVPIADIVSVVGFEPDKEECERLMQIKEVRKPWAEFKLEPIGLYNKAGAFPLHLMKANTNHSLLPSNDAFVSRYNMKQFEKIGETIVNTDTLDSIHSKRYHEKSNFGEFLKIDTQGSEFEILQGARNVLERNTVAIVCEVSFFEIYKDQKLFSDIESYLRELGFSFYGFDSSLHTRSCKHIDKQTQVTKERAMYADAVFLKDPIGTSPTTNTPRQNQSLLVCAILLGFYDFAIELSKSDLVTDDSSERDRIQDTVSEISNLSTNNTIKDLKDTLEKVSNSPENANLIVGQFVDQRRGNCDYDDVANVSQFIRNKR